LSDPIEPDDDLYRRVVSFNVNPRDNTVNSSAFTTRRPKRPDPEISVHLAREITPEECLAHGGIPGLGVASLKAHVPLSLGLAVTRDPQPGDPAHCLIKGATSMTQCSMLAEACVLVIPPPQRIPPLDQDEDQGSQT
jgi:hypothetical protein